jgi:hypothetical protein
VAQPVQGSVEPARIAIGVRKQVGALVGYWAPRNASRSAAPAAVDSSRSCPRRALATSPCRQSTSTRNCRASRAQPSAASVRRGSRTGAGQQNLIAMTEAAPASSQPNRRSAIAPAGARSETGSRMLTSNTVVALANTELTIPANRIEVHATNATTVASQVSSETSVPRHTKAPLVTTSTACAITR